MKKAFTLVELIFVILIIAIIGGIGFSSIKPNYLQRDGEFLLLKIKQARFLALGNDDETNANICIKLTKNDINNKEITDKSQNPYKLHANISVEKPTSFNTNNELCFDSQGRPHDGASYSGINVDMSNIIHSFTDIKLTYKSKNCTIRVYPYSGYGIILCEN